MKKYLYYAAVLVGTMICLVWVNLKVRLISFADPFGLYLVKLCCTVVGFILCERIQIALHEGGHLIAGLLSGYRFISYRVGRMMWMVQDGRLVRRNLSIAGTAGQCLLEYPGDYRDRPVVLYNLGGVLMNLFSALIFLALVPVIRWYPLQVFCGLMGACGVFQALVNGIPYRSKIIANDGANLMSLRNNPAARYAFRSVLAVNARLSEGLPYQEIPDELFRNSAEGNKDNPLCESLRVSQAGCLLGAGRREEAKALMQELVDGGRILGLHAAMFRADLYCLHMLDREEVPEILDADRKIYLQMKDDPAIIRTLYGEALMKKDEENARKLKERFERIAAQYPYVQDIMMNRTMMEDLERRWADSE